MLSQADMQLFQLRQEKKLLEERVESYSDYPDVVSSTKKEIDELNSKIKEKEMIKKYEK